VIRFSSRHLVTIAGTLIGIGANPAHHALGGFIERMQAVHASGVATSPVSWDVALIQYSGYWSHYDFRCDQSAWPVDPAATVPALAAFGAESGVLHEQPEVGDIFLQWTPRRATFVHAGIVVAVLARGGRGSAAPYYDVDTIEGDTNTHGHLGGGGATRVTRRLSAAKGDRFLRWTALEPGESVARAMDDVADRSA
jgi:hypothetical protein